MTTANFCNVKYMTIGLSGLYHFLMCYCILFCNEQTEIDKTLTKLTHQLQKSILRGNFYDKCNFVSLVYCWSVLYLLLLISNRFLRSFALISTKIAITILKSKLCQFVPRILLVALICRLKYLCTYKYKVQISNSYLVLKSNFCTHVYNYYLNISTIHH